MRQKNAQKINLDRVFVATNTVSELEKRKRQDNIIKDIKSFFRLRREIDNSAAKDSFRLKKEKKTMNVKIIRGINPAGKCWSPRCPEDVPVQRPQNVP